MAARWLGCTSRGFDLSPLFCSVLDHARGGAFRIASEGLRESRQYYEPDSAVLVTDMQSSTGRLRLTDCCSLISGADLSEEDHGQAHAIEGHQYEVRVRTFLERHLYATAA